MAKFNVGDKVRIEIISEEQEKVAEKISLFKECHTDGEYEIKSICSAEEDMEYYDMPVYRVEKASNTDDAWYVPEICLVPTVDNDDITSTDVSKDNSALVEKLMDKIFDGLSEFIRRDTEDSVPYYCGDCEKIDDKIFSIVEEYFKTSVK